MITTQFATNVQLKDVIPIFFLNLISQTIERLCPFLRAHIKIHVSIWDELKKTWL
jgi:hypothetical protein